MIRRLIVATALLGLANCAAEASEPDEKTRALIDGAAVALIVSGGACPGWTSNLGALEVLRALIGAPKDFANIVTGPYRDYVAETINRRSAIFKATPEIACEMALKAYSKQVGPVPPLLVKE